MVTNDDENVPGKVNGQGLKFATSKKFQEGFSNEEKKYFRKKKKH